MSFSLHSLSSQKKGAAFSFVLAVVVTALVMALFAFATSGPSFAQQFTPRWVQASAANASINVTITNIAGSTAAIKRIDFTRPGTVANHECGANLPDGWTCTRPGATPTVVQFSTTGSGIAAGASVPFMINITPPAVGGNQTFVIDTYESSGGANGNISGTPTILNVNSSVDNDFPFVQLMNISARRSDGTRISINGAQTNGLFFLPNTSDGYLFVINASDNASGMDNGRVAIYYNVSNVGIANLIPDYRNASAANVSEFVASNGTFSELGLYNVTLNLSGLPTLNGSRVVFTIVVNDSVHNVNVSNATIVTSSYAYNFTIDAVAPQFVDVALSNGSQVNTNSINITSVLTSKVEYILNSSLVLNVSALVRDDGGSGTIKVEVMNRTGGFMPMELLVGTNGSSTQTTWTLNGSSPNSNVTFNITTLVKGFAGDGLYNLTFRATDNVTNVNSTYNFTVEVDDTPPTASVKTNLTMGGILSPGNVTSVVATNSSFNITVITVSNINNNTGNVSIVGNLGNYVNLSRAGGTPSGTSFWSVTVENNTLTAVGLANMSTLCAHSDVDGKQCNIQVRFSDVMGRVNDSVNLTLVSDALGPNVSIISPVFLTTNYSGTALVNVSVNDSVGPLQNVSFRIITGSANLTGASGEGFYNATHINVTNGANMTNWIPMSLNSGGNSQLSAQGYWSFTVNLTALNFTDDSYIIQINATDSAGRQNVTVNTTGVIFDSSPPQNISFFSPRTTNTFQNVMFNITINVTDRVSGLRNVSFRLENSSFNWPWVEGNQVVKALAVDQSFNASLWNFTHFGGEPANATNGNFTIRLNVTDTAGNQNTTVTVNLTIDLIVPRVAFVYPLSSRNQSANFTVNITVTESNNNFVAYRWENHTGLTANEGQNFSNWIPFYSNQGGANNWNSTFNITEGTKLDGNYTIKVNVTDKAGNQNVSEYVQLLLDQSRPEVVAAGSLANSVQTGNFVINMTTVDNRTFNQPLGLLNSSNINATAVRLENSTASYPYFNISFPSTDFARADANRTNVTFTFASVANGNYDIRFWVNDTAGNQNSTVLVTNITLDNVAPSVAISVVNVSPAVSGGTGFSGTITFNATVQDNLPLNISITNQTTVTTQASSATYGVFYRFENSTHTLNWTSMSTPSFFNTVHNNTGVEHKALFNASNVTTTLADGDYTVRINATDRAGNQNATQTFSITIQNGGTSLRLYNFTFLGGYVTGSDTNQTSPTLLLNTSENATCLYARDDTTKNYFSDMLPQTTSNTMGNNVSRVHSTALGFLPDRAASGYSMYYACKDVGGNFSSSLGAVTLKPFSVDTRNFYNITMGSSGDNKVRADYFATGWNSFELPKTPLLANTGLPTNYNITNVLSSLGNSRLTVANFTTIFAYNGTAWSSYVVGAVTNTFTNFTADTPNSKYYINITTANERLEIN